MSEPLTLEILTKLPTKTVLHLNGGAKWSEVTQANEKYGLLLWCRTDGYPDYKYTERVLSTNDGSIAQDLLASDLTEGLARFCRAYNARTEDKAKGDG